MFTWQGKEYNLAQLQQFLKEKQKVQTEEWERSIINFSLEWLDTKNMEFIVKTSGSTGIPKTIKMTRQQMIDSALATQIYLNLKPGNSALLVLPADFIAGKMMIVRALELQMDLYYYPPQISVFDQISREFDFAAFIPLQVQYVIDSGNTDILNKIKKTIIGGAALSNDYIKRLQHLETQFFATYGMTETITHVAMKDLKNHPSNFVALPGIEFNVDNNNCLQIYSDRLPEKHTATTDIVKLISKTEFILKGRFDHIINSGGLKIVPEEIEELIQEILHAEVYVGYKKDVQLGQKLVLVLESTKQDEQRVLEKIAHSLPKNKCPKELLFIPAFLRTNNQKISRKKMQDWILEL